METHPLRLIRNLGRTSEIASVLLNHGFGDLVERMHLRRYLQWGRRLFSRKKPEPQHNLTVAERIRLSLESLGPTFIKFGQVISTRPDLVPPAVIAELAKLQENVPQFPSEEAVRLIEEQLGGRVDTLFAHFERDPIAAGSLAQVHLARHHDGAKLAVKIRRPNVVQTVERDLSLMNEFAALVERHIPEAETFDPVGLVNHFARAIRRELNFNREARTIDEFRRLFRNDATLYVPEVFWELSSEAVLTMEFIDGMRIDDDQAISQLGTSTSEIAANGARIFMKQAFELGVFHGDPHPGNIRIMPDGSICLLDYGMIGMLDEEKREQLVDLFVAIAHQNVSAAVELVQAIGHKHRPADDMLLRADVRDFVESYYGLPLERMNIGNMLTDFVRIISTHGIRCPGDLMLLIRALVTLEGVGHSLDPEFNLASVLAPFVERIVRERYNPQRMAHRLVSELKIFARLARDVPLHVGRTLEKLSHDDLKIQLEHRRLDRLMTELDRSGNRIVVGLVMSSLIVASALIIRTMADSWWISVPMFVASSFLGIWLIYGVFRSGRL